ncbi:MAG: lysoplasmalogenase [Actinobacteria bacterium]|nr:lysoplasmalogenase [Actinomycetota bacterium]
MTNQIFYALIGLTLIVAVADWWVTIIGPAKAEFVLKPLTMLVLIAATVALPDPSSNLARWAMVVALAFSMLGDVFLLSENRFFLQGLLAFFVAHLAYIYALAHLGATLQLALVGLVLVLIANAIVGRRIIAGVRAKDSAMVVPVIAYLGVVSAMVVAAIAMASLCRPVQASRRLCHRHLSPWPDWPCVVAHHPVLKGRYDTS